MTRHEIQVLRAAGIAEQAVAQRTGVSVRSVERISQEPPVTGPIRTVRVGRPALTAAWADRVAAWLIEDRALPGMEILRRAHENRPIGGRGGAVAGRGHRPQRRPARELTLRSRNHPSRTLGA